VTGARSSAGRGPGQDEQAVDQPFGAAVGGQQLLAHLRQPLRGRVLQADLDRGPLDGERGAQLVGGVGDEAALAGDRPLEAFQHRVEGVGQLLQLVAGARQRDPLLVQVGQGQATRGGRDPVQRPQHPPGQPPSRGDRHDRQDGDGDRRDAPLERQDRVAQVGHRLDRLHRRRSRRGGQP
jgi:hypothetical protein